MSIDLATPLVTALGARAADALETQLSLHTVGDLLRHYPRRYVDRGRLTDIAGLEIGEHITVVAQVEKATLRDMRSRSGKLLAVVIRDEKGAELDCTFFNGHRLKSLVKPGVRAVFSGKVGVFNRKLQLTHPQFETLDEDDEVRPFISVYPATGKLGSQAIARSVRQVLDLLDEIADPLPASVREGEGLADLGRALRRIHVPESQSRHPRRPPPPGVGRGDGGAARARAAAPGHRRTARRGLPAVAGRLLEAFDARLPFALTAGQRAVGGEIAADLAGRHPMNRLVQGDVGAGKTVVALRAMLQAVDAGRQAAMLAPTEVLAAQHARSLRALLGPLGAGGRAGCPGDRHPGHAAHRDRWARRRSGRRCSMRSPVRWASSSAPTR